MGAEKALVALEPLMTILYTLIEAGVEDSRAYFSKRNKPIHPVVFASLVRLKLWDDIEDKTRAAGLDCHVVLRGNVGIRVKWKGTTIAIWKADKDGKLPACGESGQRQLFYTQTTLDYDGNALPKKLALLWDRNVGLTVKLVAPKGYVSFWKSGLVHWEIDVPHPAKTIAAATDLASGAEELDDILRHKKTADEPNDKN